MDKNSFNANEKGDEEKMSRKTKNKIKSLIINSLLSLIVMTAIETPIIYLIIK